jgi:hypothetical protein
MHGGTTIKKRYSYCAKMTSSAPVALKCTVEVLKKKLFAKPEDITPDNGYNVL